MYAVTRILPTVTNKRCLEGVSKDNVRLMLQYYTQLDNLCQQQWVPQSDKDSLIIEIAHMCTERVQFLVSK